MNESIDETRAYFAEATVAAEPLRNEGIDIVCIAGCEFTEASLTANMARNAEYAFMLYQH